MLTCRTIFVGEGGFPGVDQILQKVLLLKKYGTRNLTCNVSILFAIKFINGMKKGGIFVMLIKSKDMF